MPCITPPTYRREPISSESLTEVQAYGPIAWVECGDGMESRWLPESEHEPDFGPVTAHFYGWGVRWSMPGYTDCGDWELFETETEARDAAEALTLDLLGEEGETQC